MNAEERATVQRAVAAIDAALDYFVDCDAGFGDGEREILHEAEEALALLRQLAGAGHAQTAPLGGPAGRDETTLPKGAD